MANARFCRVPNCGNEIGAHNNSGLCSRCHSSLYYWTQHKGNITRRLEKLALWQQRLEHFTSTDLVTVVRRCSKRAA